MKHGSTSSSLWRAVRSSPDPWSGEPAAPGTQLELAQPGQHLIPVELEEALRARLRLAPAHLRDVDDVDARLGVRLEGLDVPVDVGPVRDRVADRFAGHEAGDLLEVPRAGQHLRKLAGHA